MKQSNLSMLTIISVITFSLATIASPTSHADTYRWVDDNGVVNYAERVPRNVPAERVTRIAASSESRGSSRSSRRNTEPAVSSLPASTPATQGSQVPLNNSQKDIMSDLEAAEQVRQEQIAKIRQNNCDRSRRVLNNLTAKTRIRVRNEDGTERSLGEDERQERISAAQRGIAENCEA